MGGDGEEYGNRLIISRSGERTGRRKRGVWERRDGKQDDEQDPKEARRECRRGRAEEKEWKKEHIVSVRSG